MTTIPSGEAFTKVLRDVYGQGWDHAVKEGSASEQEYQDKRDAWIRQYLARMPVAVPAQSTHRDSMPYSLQAGEGGTFLNSEAGQLFICADVDTVRRCLAAIAAAPVSSSGDGDGGELERLSAKATSGEWSAEEAGQITASGTSPGHDTPVWGTILTARDTKDIEDGVTHWATDGERQANARYVAALVNAHRSGKLVLAPGSGEEKSSATLKGQATQQSPSQQVVSALTGECPSRDEVDFDELNRLFALMPEGPWHTLRTGGGHEIRQIDTDPTNKHHWPFRLCQSIAGQRAACDDAVFAFIAGVLNAWPSISAANSDDAFIERTLAMPEDELRKRFLVDGKCPEQAADIARQSFKIAVLKMALIQIRDQYIANRGGMTDAEALEAIGKIADKALAGEAAQAAETEGLGPKDDHAADLSATPEPSPQSSPTLKTGAMTVEEADPWKTLRKIAELRFAEDACEPFDEALDLADAALRTLQGEAAE